LQENREIPAYYIVPISMRRFIGTNQGVIMKKTNIAILLLVLMVVCTGCETFSTAAYKSTKKELQAQRVMASGNEAAIKAWKNGDTVGIGVDILAADVIMHRPIKQTAAAVADAAVIYAAKEGLEYLVGEINASSSDSKDINVTVSNSDNTSIDISSDNDTSTSSTTSTSSSTPTTTTDSSTDNSVVNPTP